MDAGAAAVERSALRLVALVTDADRRFVAASANAAQALGRPSVVGLQIDDVTVTR